MRFGVVSVGMPPVVSQAMARGMRTVRRELGTERAVANARLLIEQREHEQHIVDGMTERLDTRAPLEPATAQTSEPHRVAS